MVMRIIGLGDIHMSTAAAADIPGIRTADLVILSGDLTNYGTARNAKTVLDEILALNLNVLAQFGNMDRMEVNDYLEAVNLNLHGQARLIHREICVIGVGGSNHTPFHTPSEFSEKDLFSIGEAAFRQGLQYAELAERMHGRKIPVLFVSHVPPFGTTVDRLRNGKHVGSRAIRTLIETYQPALCISGHIHEGKGRDSVLETPVYNPGMLSRGGWVLVELNNSTLTVTLQ